MNVELIRTLHSDIEPGDHPYLRGAWAGLMECPRLSTRPGRGAHGAVKDAWTPLDGSLMRQRRPAGARAT